MSSKDPAKRAVAAAKHYQANKDKLKAYAKDFTTRRRIELREIVAELKSAPCTDCGVSYPPYVMQFDHIGDDKVANVSAMVQRALKWETIAAEIAKCELVCANCHAIRTWSRGNLPC